MFEDAISPVLPRRREYLGENLRRVGTLHGKGRVGVAAIDELKNFTGMRLEAPFQPREIFLDLRRIDALAKELKLES